MDFFDYRDKTLFCEDVAADDIAESVGTPAYVYSRKTILHHYHKLEEAFAWAEPLICYSVKACSNLSVLRILAGLGSGFDVVSGGEIERVIKAGGDPSKIVFAGVGKTDDEIELALEVGIHLFTVESEPELDAIDAAAARMNRHARVALRINPDVDPETHKYISTGKRESKFGMDLVRAGGALARRGEFTHLDAGVRAVRRSIAAFLPPEDVFSLEEDLYPRLIAAGELDPAEDLLPPRFYFSPESSPEQAEAIFARAVPGGRLLGLRQADHALLPLAQRLSVLLHLPPPYWRHTRRFSPLLRLLRR